MIVKFIRKLGVSRGFVNTSNDSSAACLKKLWEASQERRVRLGFIVENSDGFERCEILHDFVCRVGGILLCGDLGGTDIGHGSRRDEHAASS